MIRRGSTGNMVRQVQTRLGVMPDGIFGNDVETAVKNWQKQNGLKDDGVVGPTTWSAMFPWKVEQFPVQLDRLRSYIPDEVIQQIPETARMFNISNALRLAHFLAQCAHESLNFGVVYENLNYNAQGLQKVFPAYFPTLALAQQYQFKPELIASRVYGGRMGNGSEDTKEGYIFRGRGYIQLTGKNNYRAFDAFVNDDILRNPDLVATKYPLMSAAWFFHVNAIWPLCDMGPDSVAVKRVTMVVNGGYNGLDDRQKKFDLLHRLIA